MSVYTLTINPSLDYIMEIADLEIGGTNRSKAEQIFFGGKGINVSFVLKELGIPSVALGFVGGFSGERLKQLVAKAGITADFADFDGDTRINVKLKGEQITEVNAAGPEIGEEALNELNEKLGKLTENDILVIAGSMPANVLSRLALPRGIKLIADTSGEALAEVLKHKPFLIKPNLDELTCAVGKALKTEQEIILAAKTLQQKGAQNVLVSCGSQGAIFISKEGKVYIHPAFSGKVVNTVGAGDSCLAGFIAGMSKGYEYALRLACAAGGATAFCHKLAKKEEILELIKKEPRC